MREQIAKKLLEIGAVYLRPHEPFTWSSGMLSPIYCDNRLTLSYPEVRNVIAESLAEKIRSHYPETEVIAGVATGGIPHAAWVADRMDSPMIYVRSKSKDHGKKNLIEGQLEKGQNVVVIEDLISTGGSSMQAVKAVREAGANLLGVAAVFSYQFDWAKEAFDQEGIPFFSVTDYTTLLQIARKEEKIEEKDMDMLMAWRTNPHDYGRS